MGGGGGGGEGGGYNVISMSACPVSRCKKILVVLCCRLLQFCFCCVETLSVHLSLIEVVHSFQPALPVSCSLEFFCKIDCFYSSAGRGIKFMTQ